MMRSNVRLYLLVALFLLPLATDAWAQRIAVIVNSRGPIISISKRDVRDIYLGEKRFHAGLRLFPVNYGEGEVKDRFLLSVVNLSPREYKSHWAKKSFQSGIASPVVEHRSSEVIRMVSQERGGIGYVPLADVDEKKDQGIKILITIDE